MMPLEQQVCSRALSQELKALGVKQSSLFWYFIYPKGSDFAGDSMLTDKGPTSESDREMFGFVSAFTVAELGEIFLFSKYIRCHTYKGASGTVFCNILKHEKAILHKEIKDEHMFEADTEANARAKLLIFLLKTKLMEI